jgi:hypothetical protein
VLPGSIPPARCGASKLLYSPVGTGPSPTRSDGSPALPPRVRAALRSPGRTRRGVRPRSPRRRSTRSSARR